MPVCFRLIRKGETEATPLSKIDNELCAALGVEPHPITYYAQWFDFIGIRLAIGQSFDEIIARLEKGIKDADEAGDEGSMLHFRKLYNAARWLSENFTPECWRENK